MSQINCQFLEPKITSRTEGLANPTGDNQNFQFSKMVCQIENPVAVVSEEPIAVLLEDPAIYELIENPEYPREFFVEKTFSYGDALIIWFLTLFLIFLIAKTIFNFFWGK